MYCTEKGGKGGGLPYGKGEGVAAGVGGGKKPTPPL